MAVSRREFFFLVLFWKKKIKKDFYGLMMILKKLFFLPLFFFLNVWSWSNQVFRDEFLNVIQRWMFGSVLFSANFFFENFVSQRDLSFGLPSASFQKKNFFFSPIFEGAFLYYFTKNLFRNFMIVCLPKRKNTKKKLFTVSISCWQLIKLLTQLSTPAKKYFLTNSKFPPLREKTLIINC